MKSNDWEEENGKMDERSGSLRIDDVDRERLEARVKDFVRVVIKNPSAAIHVDWMATSLQRAHPELTHMNKEQLADATEVILRGLGRTTLRSLSKNERKGQRTEEKVVAARQKDVEMRDEEGVTKQKDADVREKEDVVRQEDVEMRAEAVIVVEKETVVAAEKVIDNSMAPESQKPDTSAHKQERSLLMTPMITVHDGGVVELERPPTPKKDRRRRRAALKAAETARKTTPKVLKKRATEKAPEKCVAVATVDTVKEKEAPMYTLGDRKEALLIDLVMEYRMKAWENCKEPDMLVAAAPDDKVKLYAYREKRKIESVNVPEKLVQPEQKNMTHDLRRQSGPPSLLQRAGQRNECPNKRVSMTVPTSLVPRVKLQRHTRS